MFSGERLLGIFAHPDDESYSAGGTLALAAQSGMTVSVASATRGEGGGDPDVRTRELIAACNALGIAAPIFLDLPDGKLTRENTTAAISDLLADHRPDVVLTLGEDGAYGHPDHIVLTQTVRNLHHRVGLMQFPRGLFGKKRGTHDPELTIDITAVRDRKRAAIEAHVSQRAFLRPELMDPLLDLEWINWA